MLKYLFQDFKEHNFSKARTINRIILDRGCSAVFLYRVSSWCRQHKMKLLSNFFAQLNIFINSCEIGNQVEIGPGFRIYHATGIVIYAAKIGSNFSIYQNVTVGKNGYSDNTGRETPIIGNDVSLYVGCVLGGPISIGNNVKVGANSVVLKDIPSNSIAIGNPVNVKTKKMVVNS